MQFQKWNNRKILNKKWCFYENFTVPSFTEFHELVKNEFPLGCVYRGLKDESYPLIPSFGRLLDNYKKRGGQEKALLLNEHHALEIFQTACVQYVDVLPEGKLELLALAQHHGLPTRLMDWTLNPLVALFFATEKDFEGDSVVYVYVFDNKRQVILRQAEAKVLDPYGINEVLFFSALPLSPRMSAQSGILSVQPIPDEEFKSKFLSKITIKGEGISEIKKTLFKYGLHRGTLFPGLDGICSKIKQWKFSF